jgi:hypothetical protein
MTYSSTTAHTETKTHGFGAALFCGVLTIAWAAYTAFYFYEMLRVTGGGA